MVRRRFLSSGVHALRGLLLLLLLRLPVTPGTTCPTPMSVEHADIRVKSYTLNSRERYVCNSGFKRKAGTSSLTECVLNKTTNTAHWTTPSLKCIRDPSLTHQRPVPHSTVVTARVTPQPESPSPSGKEPAVLSPKSDTTVATETAMVPGSQSMPPQPTSSGTTSVGSHEFSQAPSQTTAKTLELTPSNSHETPDASSYSSRETTVIISTSVTLSVVLVVCALVTCIKLRRIFQPTAVEMENLEVMPMTRGSSSREEDQGNYPQNSETPGNQPSKGWSQGASFIVAKEILEDSQGSGHQEKAHQDHQM
ncbi:interleukin-15 receptor subunit alpha isoform X1 [Marmota monax]|uniref:interleukin-15 receptor subunit alpha isoform X1 n=2 Tax=Marmota monax TaxID=9995 RepID=UPI001EAFD222|nr:interleukin-15 receptor subunit alpha isoform X1 [Marmota monax]